MDQPMQHKLTEALDGKDLATDANVTGDHLTPEPQGHGSTPEQVAEATRREQEARSHGRPDRDDYLVTVGRGQQTHG